MNWYCDSAPGHPLHGPYHDDEYGLPRSGEAVLFELLALEIFQAGLSWQLILKKRPTIFAAFDKFDVDIVADYGDLDIERLLGDGGIIRNRLKITSIIENGNRIRAMRDSHGGFGQFIDDHHPLIKSDWVKLFKNTLKFTGGEIVNEFLMSLGYLPGAHRQSCPAYQRIMARKPPWSQVDDNFYQETAP